MLDVLLVNPLYNTKKMGKYFLLVKNPMPPLGLAYISGTLQSANYRTKILDACAELLSEEEITTAIQHFNPRIVGFSVLTPAATIVKRLISRIRLLLPDLTIVCGNIHASLFPEEFLNQGADIVVNGEGESALKLIADYVIRQQGRLRDLPGIVYRSGKDIVTNPKPPAITDPNELPFPDWSDLPLDKYSLMPFGDTYFPAITVIASRGCPNNCKYCSVKSIFPRYVVRSPKNIVDELELLVTRYKIRTLVFIDPTFPFQKDFVRELCDEIIQRKLPQRLVWGLETHLEQIDVEMLPRLHAAGCRKMLFGIESSSAQILQNMNRRFDRPLIRERLRALQKNRINTVGFFMLGLPGETEETAEETIRFALELDLDFAKFALAVPFPGSEFYNYAIENNLLRNKDWENFSTFTHDPDDLVYVPESMTPKKLLALQRKAHLSFYLRPSMVFRQLFIIRTLRLSVILKALYALLSE